MLEYVNKCRLCGTIYESYAFEVGDHSVCMRCRMKARGATNAKKAKSWFIEEVNRV